MRVSRKQYSQVGQKQGQNYEMNGVHPAVLIISYLIFAAAVVLNFLIGLKSKKVSDEYHLRVTPPRMTFYIWSVIYILLSVIYTHNLFTNVWNLKVHILFSITHICAVLWMFTFTTGVAFWVYFSVIMVFLVLFFIWWTWFSMGEDPIINYYEEYSNNTDMPCWHYFSRNVVALYGGFMIASVILALGIFFVYSLKMSRETQATLFWIMSAILFIVIFLIIWYREGKRGILCSIAMWIGFIWAIVGALITAFYCNNENNDHAIC